MAIIVEEGEKRTNILGILGWLVFLGIAAVAIYYVFFAQPEFVTVSGAGNLSNIAPITQSQIQPNTVLQNPVFTTLKETIPQPSPTGPASVGRTNPFVTP